METKIYDDKLIVITGAAGCIGSAVVHHLNDQGFHNLLLVDTIDQTDKWKNLLHKNFIDLIPPLEFLEWLEGKESEIEAFIHLGACSDTQVTDGEYVLDNNYRYSIALAEYALEHGHRFVYASSAATYGDGSRGFSDDHDLLEELEPLNLYGFSKHLFDLWIKNQGVIDQVVGLKYFNIFGPNEGHKGKMASMVWHMFHQIQEEGKVCLFRSNQPDTWADGEQQRDFYYVKDAAALTCCFLENDLGGIFNVGMGKPHSWNTLAGAVFQAMGQPVRIDYIPIPAALSKQYQNYTCADLTKLIKSLEEKELPPQPSTPLIDAVTEYVQEYLIPERRL